MFNHILTDVIEMIIVSSKCINLYDAILKVIPKLNEKYYKNRILYKLSKLDYYKGLNINSKFYIELSITKSILIGMHRSYNKPSTIYTNGTIFFDYTSKQRIDDNLPMTIYSDGIRCWNNRCDDLPRLVSITTTPEDEYIYEYNNIWIKNNGHRTYKKNDNLPYFERYDKIDIFNFI